MDKQTIKNILMSMRTQENEFSINNLLGTIDMMKQEEINTYLEKIGNPEEALKNFLKDKITQHTHVEQSVKHVPINNMFTYGVSGNSIHLHLPGDLHEMISQNGLSKTIDTVNLNLLDTINKIKTLKDNNYYRFSKADNIYMISPILIGKELKFLKNMDFSTTTFKKRDLQNPEFIKENSEAQLATSIFGDKQNIGTAIIDFDTIRTSQWQEKCRFKIKEFEQKNIFLKQDKNQK